MLRVNPRGLRRTPDGLFSPFPSIASTPFHGAGRSSTLLYLPLLYLVESRSPAEGGCLTQRTPRYTGRRNRTLRQTAGERSSGTRRPQAAGG